MQAKWLAVVLAIAACQTIEQRKDTTLLSSAGFRIVAANTPERINALKTLPPEKISKIKHNGEPFYVYPDPKDCRCLRVGRQEQYDMYERLASGKRATTFDTVNVTTDSDILRGYDW
ncbi:MAG TPA: hypothetical protein VMR31_16600 [Myxococcota bacterium]|jgi:hypothetical protein|nr:hypothetical protein [Myxococcota bacterium]